MFSTLEGIPETLWQHKPPFLAKATCCIDTIIFYGRIKAALYEQMKVGRTFHPGGLSHSAVAALVMNYASVGLWVVLFCFFFPLSGLSGVLAISKRPYKHRLREVPHDSDPEVAV